MALCGELWKRLWTCRKTEYRKNNDVISNETLFSCIAQA